MSDTKQLETVPLEALRPHPDNPRRGDVDGLMGSLERFGQVRPILVVDDIIIAGNHTYEAARRLGWKHIQIDRREMDRDTALAYMLADNRLADKASYDDASLLKILTHLNDDDQLEATGYGQDDLEDILNAIEGVPTTTPEEFTGGFAEPEQATADRWEGRDEGNRREVVFLLLEADFERFNANVERIQKEWGLTSKAETIASAIEHVANSSQSAKHPNPGPLASVLPGVSKLQTEPDSQVP